MLALWSWHAAEESEHRATCFDLYQACGGGYRQRVLTMVLAWSLLVGVSLVNTLALLENDGRLYTWDTLKGLGYLFGRKGAISRMLPPFLAYFKPSFHPWSGLDGTDVARWQAANERYVVNLEQVQAQQARELAAPTTGGGRAGRASSGRRLARKPSTVTN